MRPASYSPQPSLNGTHCTIDVLPLCWSTSALSSFSYRVRPAVEGSLPLASAGMSCQTIRPSLSAQ
jgi:hypothetical protein